MRWTTALAVCLLGASAANAQLKAKAAREAAEALIERFGSRAGRSVPVLTGRIEGLVAKHGDEALLAVKKGGPSACGLIDAAGPDGAKAVRVLVAHGEQGASRVLSRPAAMKQYLQHGDQAASVLVRHPGVAEPLIERGRAQAVRALGAVTPQNGRRLAMLMEGELSQAARHPELLGVVAKHGDGEVEYLFRNKAVLAGGAALTAFLAEPEAFLDGTLTEFAGEAVVKPVVGGVFTLLYLALGTLGVLLVVVVGLAYRHGPPSAESVKTVVSLLKK